MDEILVDRSDGIVTVTLNRPERLNAVTGDMWIELRATFDEVTHHPDDRVMVITGAGGAFSSGQDLAKTLNRGHTLNTMRAIGEAALALHRVPKPTIAKVDGIAAGAGLNLALGCDLIVASERARFSEIFARRGLTIDFGGSWLLPRLVGMHRAKELVLLADIVPAEDALAMGLVNRVVPVDELDGFVHEWATRLAHGPTLSLSMSKHLLNQAFDVSMSEALEAEALAQSVTGTTEDSREAISAFFEKREPAFRGR